MTNILPYCDEIMQLLLENLGVRRGMESSLKDGFSLFLFLHVVIKHFTVCRAAFMLL